MFIDRVTITIKSGKGGDGSVSFRREAFVPEGGPDGGDGGKGGDIVFKANGNMRTLLDFRYKKKYQAEDGENGRGKKQFGKNGKDYIINVPVGTLLIDKESGKVMKDFTESGDTFTAVVGGKGGKGNERFKSPVRQAPNFAEAGESAKERQIILELKLIADVGLIGFPNVGKSTLLSVVTGANPKIDNYHFTTLSPNLGVVQYGDESFVMADIPGLIEGAHTGAGLGLDFLRHIERTRLLIHVVDVSGIEGRDPIDDFKKINKELSSYGNRLSDKPQIVAANKIDITDEESYKRFEEYITSLGLKIFPISAPIHQGVSQLIDSTYTTLVSLPVEEIKYDYFDPLRDEADIDDKNIDCSKDDDVYVLSGERLDKIFRSTNFTDMGSIRYLYKYIEDNGAIDELKKMGLQDGDTIRINEYEFEYIGE